MIKAKRFWKDVRIEEGEGYGIMLDERALKTPYQNPLQLPSRALAEAVAQEWREVEGEIVPDSMPMTKMANSAIERIPNQRVEVENHLLVYLEDDLLIYRVDAPEELANRLKAWDVWVLWAKTHGIRLVPTMGIVAKAQPRENQRAAQSWIARLSPYEMVSFYDYVTITGSFVLGMAIFERALSPRAGFDLSRIDDDYQGEQWGVVEEKAAERDYKLQELLRAATFQDFL